MIGMSYLIQETPELEFFNYLDYDAVGLGNHGKLFFSPKHSEFDGHQDSLVQMIKKSNKIPNMHVPILTSNMEVFNFFFKTFSLVKIVMMFIVLLKNLKRMKIITGKVFISRNIL
jgi:hypothetical protein